MGKGKNIERQVAVELVVSYPEKRSINITVSYPFVNGVFCVKNNFVALFQKAIGRVQDKVLSFGFPIGIIPAGHFVPIHKEGKRVEIEIPVSAVKVNAFLHTGCDKTDVVFSVDVFFGWGRFLRA